MRAIKCAIKAGLQARHAPPTKRNPYDVLG